jgi:mannose/fructose-specific phosphotransferase system component IIA
MSTGVVLVVNGHYAAQLRAAAEALVGPLDLAIAVVEQDVRAGASEMRQRVSEAVTQQDHGQGILFLTDLCGSTPANICLSFLAEKTGSELITGLNLAMLIKLSTCDRQLAAGALAAELHRTSQRSIKLGSEIIAKGGCCD